MTDVSAQAPAIAHVGNSLVRETSGRFVKGIKGGPGRPKGARSRISETLLALFADHVETNAKDALDRLAARDPEAYLRLSISLMPRAGETIPYSEMSDDEFQDEYIKLKTNKQIKAMLDCEGL